MQGMLSPSTKMTPRPQERGHSFSIANVVHPLLHGPRILPWMVMMMLMVRMMRTGVMMVRR